MFILGVRGFSWAVSVFSQVFKVTRAFFLFFLFSYFSFLWIDPRFFSRPTPGESSSSHARKKLWYPGLETFSQADILPNGRYVIRWAALCCFCFFGGRSSFISSLQIMQNFLTFSPATKRLKNNWAKATSSSRLFVCRSNFPAVYCWSHFTGYCKRYWRIRNLSQSESVKYNWNGYWAVLCSEVVPLCLSTSVDREFLGWGWVTNLRSYSYGRLASCKEVQGSPSLCHWNLDSLFKSLLGFRIPWAVCWIPEPEVSAFH